LGLRQIRVPDLNIREGFNKYINMINFVGLCEKVLIAENAPKKTVVSATGVNGTGATTVTYDDGSSETLRGPRPIRNNNPGNLEYGDFAVKQGAVGTDGRYAVFPTPQDGWNAKVNLLKTNTYQKLSIQDAFNRYAPPSENPNYIRDLQGLTGFDLNRPMNTLNDQEFKQLVDAVAKIEGAEQYVGKFSSSGKPGSMTQTPISFLKQPAASPLVNWIRGQSNAPLSSLIKKKFDTPQGEPTPEELTLLKKLHNSPYNPGSSTDRKNLNILRQAGKLTGGYQDFAKLVPTAYAIQYGDSPTGQKYRSQAERMGIPIDDLFSGSGIGGMTSGLGRVMGAGSLPSASGGPVGPSTIPGSAGKDGNLTYDKAWQGQGQDPGFKQLLKQISGHIGKPFYINSGYRDPAYNAKVSDTGRTGPHTEGTAADISTAGWTDEEKANLINVASAYGIKGIGIYKNFVHLDMSRNGVRTWGLVPSWAMQAITNHKNRSTFQAAQMGQSPTGP